MKNLKRALSFALASVMVIGMMVVGAGAAFTDADKIANDEAVDVMVALDVISGKGDGSYFDPAATLTRAEAAKIITYMLLGADKAEKLGNTGVQFTDVPANHWAASYIGYCANMGIISGYAGEFNPTGELTGLAFGKMLLVALGYDAEIEAYTGTSEWGINVAVDMVEAGIDLDDIVLADPISRDDACQMAFQTLTANLVKYGDKGTTITTGGVTIVTGADKATAINKTDANYSDDTTGAGKEQFCEKYFPDLNKVTTQDGAKDAFGRPGYTWTFNDADIDDIFVAKTPVKTYTTAVAPQKVYNDLGLKSAKEVTWFIDGWTDTVGNGTKLTLNKGTGYTDKIIGGDGVLTEVYKVGTNYTVVQIANYMAKVTKVTEYKAATDKADEVKASIDLEVYGTDYGTVDFEKFETTGFKKGDYVVVTLVNAHDGDKITVKSAVAAKSFDGVMSKYTTSAITVDGTAHTKGAKYAGVAIDSIGFKSTYTYYTDANGIVLYSKLKAAAVSTDYVWVEEYQVKVNSDLFAGSSKAVKAKVVFTDGTNTIIDLKVTKDGDNYKFKAPTIANNAATGAVADATITNSVNSTDVNYWYAYTENTDGTYTLSALPTDYAAVDTSVTLTKDKTTELGTGYYTNKATVVTAIDGDYKVTSFTGYPTENKALTGNGQKVLYTFAKDSKVITNIFVAEQTVTGADKTYAYAVKAGATAENGTEWIFAINGKQETYVISGSNTPEAGKVYTLTESTAKAGTYEVDAGTEISGTKVTVIDESFVVAGNTYELTDSTLVFNVDADLEDADKGAADSIEKDDYIYVIETAANSGKAKIVYITAEAE